MNPELRVSGCDRLQIGCDIHSVQSTQNSITQFGDRYLDRVFTARERQECGDTPERLAARFAGKEAVLKALRVPPAVAVPWTAIELHADASGAPSVSLTGRAKDFAREAGFDRVEVTLSHDGGVALAFALAHAATEPSGVAA